MSQPFKRSDERAIVAASWTALRTALQALEQLGEIPREFSEIPGRTNRMQRDAEGKWRIQHNNSRLPGWVNSALATDDPLTAAQAFEEARMNAAREIGAVPDYTWSLTNCGPAYVDNTTLITCPAKQCGRPVELLEGAVIEHQHPQGRTCRASFVRIVPMDPI
ncbi:hypothetical protein [Kitasatospora cineracea]|uniref:hypothetical protein n=1 Tax=Kitasatospora cineracea TaxID=88074 RepID=UPI00381612D4